MTFNCNGLNSLKDCRIAFMSRHIWWGQVNWISFEGGSNNWSVLVEGGVLSAVKGGGKPQTSPPMHVYVEHNTYAIY